MLDMDLFFSAVLIVAAIVVPSIIIYNAVKKEDES